MWGPVAEERRQRDAEGVHVPTLVTKVKLQTQRWTHSPAQPHGHGPGTCWACDTNTFPWRMTRLTYMLQVIISCFRVFTFSCLICLQQCTFAQKRTPDGKTNRAQRGRQSAGGPGTRPWSPHLCRLAPRWRAPVCGRGRPVASVSWVTDHGSRCLVLSASLAPEEARCPVVGPLSRPTESPRGRRQVSCPQLQLPTPVNESPLQTGSQSSLWEQHQPTSIHPRERP